MIFHSYVSLPGRVNQRTKGAMAAMAESRSAWRWSRALAHNRPGSIATWGGPGFLQSASLRVRRYPLVN